MSDQNSRLDALEASVREELHAISAENRRLRRARRRQSTWLALAAFGLLAVGAATAMAIDPLQTGSGAGEVKIDFMPNDPIAAAEFNDNFTALVGKTNEVVGAANAGPKRQFIAATETGTAVNLLTKSTSTLGFNPAYLSFTGDPLMSISPAVQTPNTPTTFTCVVARCVVDASLYAGAAQTTTNQQLQILVGGAPVMRGNSLNSEATEYGLHVSAEFLMTQGQQLAFNAFMGVEPTVGMNLAISVVGYDQ